MLEAAGGLAGAWPETTGETATTVAAASAAPTPGRPRIGARLATGLLGASTTRSAPVSAGSTAGAGRAAASPSCSTARTAGRARRATRYSWNGSRPSSVTTTVRTGSSLIGTTAASTPRARPRSAVASDSEAPARSRPVRRSDVARSTSPTANHPEP